MGLDWILDGVFNGVKDSRAAYDPSVFRTPASPCDTRVPLCVGRVLA